MLFTHFSMKYLHLWSKLLYQIFRKSETLQKPEGWLWKKSFHLNQWNSEVETTWISLIGWSLRTSISYTFTSLVHHILCIVKHVGMKIIAFTVTSKQTLYALNHYVLLSVLPKVFTQKNHSCRVRMDSFLHRRRSGDNGIKNGFLFDIQTRIKTEA